MNSFILYLVTKFRSIYIIGLMIGILLAAVGVKSPQMTKLDIDSNHMHAQKERLHFYL